MFGEDVRSRGGDLPMLRDPSRQFRLLTQLAERDRETVRETETDSDRDLSTHTLAHTQGERESGGERGRLGGFSPGSVQHNKLITFLFTRLEKRIYAHGRRFV